MPDNLGELDELKIAIDSLYTLHRSFSTIERLTGMNYFKNPHETIDRAKSLLGSWKANK